MRLQKHTPPLQPSLRLLTSAAAVLISLFGLLLVGALVQPTQAASEIAVPVKPGTGREVVQSSAAMTYQVYLPLLMKRY